MLKFIIQREYLLPVYQYEADTFEEAHAEAAGPGHDWYNAEEDYDGSLPTTITNAKMVPEGATTDHYLIEGGPRQQSGAHPKAAVLDLQRPGLRETRTLRRRQRDSNSRSRREPTAG